MKNFLRFFLALAALPLAAQNTTLQKVPATPATASSNKLVESSKVIVVGDGGSISATGTGVIAATSVAGGSISPTAPLTGGGPISGVVVIGIPKATTSVDGYLFHTDWATFNAKQPAGNYLTALTGDATAAGPGSAALTLATVNANVGTFAGVTLNGKGLATSAVALTLSTTAPLTGGGTLGNLTFAIPAATNSIAGYLTAADHTSFAAKQPAGNYLTALTGDVAASGPGSAAATLASVATAGTTGSSTAIPVVTIDIKGRTTSISTAAVVAPAGTLTGTTLASNVVTSSLTSVGTIASGTWQGTAIANAYLANPSLTLGSTALTLGTTTTSIAGLGTLGWTNGTNDLVARTITPAAGYGLFREYVATGSDSTDTPIYVNSYNLGTNGHQDVAKAGWIFQIEPNYLGQAEMIWAVNSVTASGGVPTASTRYWFVTGNVDGSGGVARLPGTVYFDSPSSSAATRSFVFNVGAGTINFGGATQISDALTVNGALVTNSSFSALTTIKAGTAIGVGTLPITIPSDSQLYVYGNTVAGIERIDASGTNTTQLTLAANGVDKWSIYRGASNVFTIGRSGIADDLTLDTSGNLAVLQGSITGGAGNMTITSGTGNSRTMALRTTTSGGTATTFLTGNADQSATFAAALTAAGDFTRTGTSHEYFTFTSSGSNVQQAILFNQGSSNSAGASFEGGSRGNKFEITVNGVAGLDVFSTAGTTALATTDATATSAALLSNGGITALKKIWAGTGGFSGASLTAPASTDLTLTGGTVTSVAGASLILGQGSAGTAGLNRDLVITPVSYNGGVQLITQGATVGLFADNATFSGTRDDRIGLVYNYGALSSAEPQLIFIMEGNYNNGTAHLTELNFDYHAAANAYTHRFLHQETDRATGLGTWQFWGKDGTGSGDLVVNQYGDTTIGQATDAGTTRLYVAGIGTTSATASFRVTNSGGTNLIYARDDVAIGIGNTPVTGKTLYVEGAMQIGNGGSSALTIGGGIIGSQSVGSAGSSRWQNSNTSAAGYSDILLFSDAQYSYVQTGGSSVAGTKFGVARANNTAFGGSLGLLIGSDAASQFIVFGSSSTEYGRWTTGGAFSIATSTASTTTATGALINAGGFGNGGAINTGTYISAGTAALLTGTGDIAGSGWAQSGAPTGGTAAKHKIGALVTGLTLSLLAADGIEYEAADGTKLYLLVATRP